MYAACSSSCPNDCLLSARWMRHHTPDRRCFPDRAFPGPRRSRSGCRRHGRRGGLVQARLPEARIHRAPGGSLMPTGRQKLRQSEQHACMAHDRLMRALCCGRDHCDLRFARPLRMSSLFGGASGARKSGIVLGVRRGRKRNSTGHSVMRSSLT